MSGEAERELITTSLELEKLDTNLFRSKTLYTPQRARGVFGGQVISLAVLAATKCVNEKFALHSLHCYFLLSASSALPMLFYVERLREGRTYTTRSVKSVQNGRIVFTLTCSFKLPEPTEPSYQWPMPTNVPAPKDCISEDSYYEALSKKGDLTDRQRENVKLMLEDRRKSPIDIRLIGDTPSAGTFDSQGVMTRMYWMRARGIPKFEAPFQKCILAYLSDLHFIGTAVEAVGLTNSNRPGSKGRLGMTSSLDHSVWYYSDDFDCANWLLYVMNAVRAGYGRGVVEGRVYTEDGQLVAATTQEGVIRPAASGQVQADTQRVEVARAKL